jgi:6-phosphogluconolactonase
MREKSEGGMSRRDFVGVTAAVLLGANAPLRAMTHGGVMQADGSWEVYVGTYTADGASRGIYRLALDRRTGAFRDVTLAAETSDPSYLALTPDRRTLVAVNELVAYGGEPSGALTTFARDDKTGSLTRIAERASLGGAPCYVTVDRAGRHALVANYVGGNVAVFPIDARGAPGPHAAFVQHEGKGADPARQAGPHAHCIRLDAANRFAYAADLGIDRVRIYRFDAATGALRPAATPEVALAPGAGPRHLAFAPDGRTLYVVNELDSTLVALAVDPATGALRPRHRISTRPPSATGANAPADLHVHPTGRAVYVSNRGDDTIAVFSVQPGSGTLTLRQSVATGGHWPRNFALDPSGRWLLVAHQRSHAITSLAVDAATGFLTRTGAEAQVPAPVCLLFSGAQVHGAE